ncbi:hypothetical protein MTO96_028838 [Rhipicephalus appendiculatus]
MNAENITTNAITDTYEGSNNNAETRAAWAELNRFARIRNCTLRALLQFTGCFWSSRSLHHSAFTMIDPDSTSRNNDALFFLLHGTDATLPGLTAPG